MRCTAGEGGVRTALNALPSLSTLSTRVAQDGWTIEVASTVESKAKAKAPYLAPN